MTDSRTLAYINLYAVLGTGLKGGVLDCLVLDLDSEMKLPVSVCFDVKGGPAATIKITK